MDPERFFVSKRRDSNPQGYGAEETRSVFQRSTQGAKRRSGTRMPQADAESLRPISAESSWHSANRTDAAKRRDSNPQGCGAEETRSVFQRSTQGAKRRSGTRPPKRRTRNPSVPYQQRAPRISAFQPNRHLGTFLKCRPSTWCRAAPAGRTSHYRPSDHFHAGMTSMTPCSVLILVASRSVMILASLIPVFTIATSREPTSRLRVFSAVISTVTW